MILLSVKTIIHPVTSLYVTEKAEQYKFASGEFK